MTSLKIEILVDRGNIGSILAENTDFNEITIRNMTGILGIQEISVNNDENKMTLKVMSY